MIQIVDKGDRIKVVKDNNNISVYDKVVGSVYLDVRVSGGSFQILRGGVVLDSLGSYQSVSTPVVHSFDDLIDALLVMIYNGAVSTIWSKTGGTVHLTDLTEELAIGTTTANSSAIVDFSSTTKGFLIPRMTTTQRDAISTPASGLIVYNTTTNETQYYNGSTWASAGEVNTASNVGSGSGTEYGVFKQKSGVDLEFKKVKQGSNITLTENTNDITIAAAGGATDLAATANGTSLTISSSTGTNATVPAVTTSAWGAMTDEDKTKLDGISADADKYYSQNLIDTTGGTIDAPYGTPAILTSTANFYLTVAETGTYIIYGSVNIDEDLNKDNNALELIYGIDDSTGSVIGPAPYQQNMQGKKNKRNGIQGTWLGVSLTAGDRVHMYMSTCDDSCTWLGGRIFIAQWK